MEPEVSRGPAGGMESDVSGEPAVIEENAKDMIALHSWFLIGGEVPNIIIVNHPNNNAVFECQADNGKLFPHYNSERYDDNEQKVRAKPGGRFDWMDYDEDEHDFVEIVLKLGQNIIGYAVIDVIRRFEPESHVRWWDALVLKSVLFPQEDGKYQNVSEEYVKTAIEKVKNEHPVEKGGGYYIVKLLPSWSSIPQEGAFAVDYSDSNAVFECSVDNGQFGSAQDSPKSLFVKPGTTIYWHSDPEGETKEAFVEIILRIGDNIIGYALIGIEQYRGRNPTDYGAVVIRTVLFPQTGGEYQKISEEYVHTIFEALKSMWRKGEGIK
jgi:hypothetical protein